MCIRDRIEADAGVKLHGQLSRQFPQKSFKLYAKSRYGPKTFNYAFFGKHGLPQYERIVLRNGGTDWLRALLRDGFASVIADEMHKLDAMAFRPTTLFLNGSFYGIQNLRERIDEKYISSKYSIPENGIDLLEDYGVLRYGSREDFDIMSDSVLNYNFESSNAYQFIDRNFDVDNIIDFVFIELFLANIDWPWKNMKFWKSSLYDNKWRWIINDLDYTCGISSFPEINMMPLLTNRETSFSKIFSALLENDIFRYKFINRSADYLNSIFLPENLVGKLDSLSKIIEDEIPRQQNKYISSAVNWQGEIDIIRDFVRNRNKFYSNQYIDYFNLSDTCSVTLNVYPQQSGKIKVSSLTPDKYPWTGRYFFDVPVEFEAIPNAGYSFVKWSQDKFEGNKITVYLTNNFTLNAVFAKNEQLLPLVINEIMYRPADEKDCKDWIEIYNPNDYAVSLAGNTFKDENEDNVFHFPDNAIIDGNDYLVVSENPDEFKKHYPASCDILGPFNFGIGKSDQIRLYDSFGQIVDSVAYSNESPWPAGSDRTGRSIELIKWDRDNNIGSNWQSSYLDMGTPCNLNSIISSVENNSVVAEDLQITTYPNPASTMININFLSERDCISSVSIYDIHGFERIRKNSIMAEAGTNNVEVDVQSLEAGIYIIQINTGGGILTSSLRVVR